MIQVLLLLHMFSTSVHPHFFTLSLPLVTLSSLILLSFIFSLSQLFSPSTGHPPLLRSSFLSLSLINCLSLPPSLDDMTCYPHTAIFLYCSSDVLSPVIFYVPILTEMPFYSFSTASLFHILCTVYYGAVSFKPLQPEIKTNLRKIE